MMDAEVIEGLFDKGESCEQKKEIKNKAEIDQVIDEICALFNKKELGRIWTPQDLFLKFMEFLPNQRKKTDDVISVSFWPPYPKRRQANDVKEALVGRQPNFLSLAFI